MMNSHHLQKKSALILNGGLHSNLVSTIQLLSYNYVLTSVVLFSKSSIQGSLSLINFLNNPNYTFTGVGIQKDIQKLVHCGLGRGPNRQSFASYMVSIQQLAAQKYGWSMNGLNMNVLARGVLGIDPTEPENVRISAWDNQFLTDQQVRYASKDAFLSSEMGKVLLTEYRSFS
ncbi:Werner syndrome-like exonuclease [Tanacetum coccineum]